jgi:hypothetical protein
MSIKGVSEHQGLRVYSEGSRLNDELSTSWLGLGTHALNMNGDTLHIRRLTNKPLLLQHSLNAAST